MSTNSKYLLALGFILPAVLSLYPSCSGTTITEPSERQTILESISDSENIIWQLFTVEKSGRPVDISTFPPFHLIFGESQFFGDDGCNLFGAPYRAQEDSIFPGKLSQTLRLCDQATLPVEYLAEPFRIRFSENEMRIFSNGGIYTYRSGFTSDVQGSALLGNWQLNSSTDADFEDIQKRQLIPVLSFDAKRQFNIIWYCVEDNPFGCDKIGGIFGIGAGGKILFYERESAHHGEESGANFMQRILNSTSYEVAPNSRKGAVLTLFNHDNGTSFEFVAIRKFVE